MQLQTTLNAEPIITDTVLAHQAVAGDQYAFESLVRRYSTSLYSFITRFLGDHDQASDILQQVSIQLYTSLPTLRADRPLKAWLFQVARNRCVDELRRKRVLHFSELEGKNDEDEVSVVDALLDSTPLPEELAECHDLQERLQKAIDTLPVKFRSVVLLRYAGQLSFPEIGQTLNMPVATAKTYFHRAKPLLRTALTKEAKASEYNLQ